MERAEARSFRRKRYSTLIEVRLYLVEISYRHIPRREYGSILIMERGRANTIYLIPDPCFRTYV